MDFKKPQTVDFKPLTALGEAEAAEEARALREAISHHDYLYYIKNHPAISDELYDRLFARLQRIEEAFPALLAPDSPTQRVGVEPVGRLNKIEHVSPMLSLQAVMERSEVENFLSSVRQNTGRPGSFVIEPKIDGFSVEIIYRGGRFSHGATRGNGLVGEDISHNLKTIGSLPLQLRGDAPELLAVRGEVFMTRAGFQKLNRIRVQNGEEPLANPRNAAAGMMRQLDPRMVAGKPLEIVFYDVQETNSLGFSSHWQLLGQLSIWGLKTSPFNRRVENIEEMVGYHRELLENRDDLPFEIDGVVVKLDDLSQRSLLGTRHRSPRWALAWKFTPKESITMLEEIVVSVGRSGLLTPVAMLRPVNVGGVTVSRATLHNESEVRRKDVRSGDTVRVIRAGDVIPEVAERLEIPDRPRREPFAMPERCPACGSPVYKQGAYWFCPAGLTCSPQQVGRLRHYAARDALDIAGLGEKTARGLVQKGLALDIADLYELTVGDILQLEGFAQKSAEQLYASIQSAKNPSFDRFLYALGITHVGQRVATILATRFRRLEDLENADAAELEKVADIGPEIARHVSRFFAEPANRKVLTRLSRLGVKVGETGPEVAEDRPLAGKTFVFTGRLDGFTRTEAGQVVERLGGRVASSVSGTTDYVVAGENPGGKIERARRLNIAVLDEQAFKALVEG